MINNFMVLDGYKYKTNANSWVEIERSPRQLKRLLSSKGDVTFGVSSHFSWSGDIFAEVTPQGEGWGSKETLEATFRKQAPLSFVDHYGNSFTVTVSGEMKKQSVLPDWDDPENKFNVFVEIATL